MKIDVHIERVIVDGMALETVGREQLQTALERELTGLLGERPLHAELAAGATLAAAPTTHIQLASSAPDHIGSQAARAVATALTTATPQRSTTNVARGAQ